MTDIAKVLWAGLTRLDLMKADTAMADPGPAVAPVTPPTPTTPVVADKPPKLSRHDQASRLMIHHARQLVKDREHLDEVTALSDPRLKPYVAAWLDSCGATS